QHMSRPRSRTTRSASGSTAGAARSTSRASTTPASTSRRWRMPSCTSTSGCTAALAFNTLASSAELAAHLGDWRIFDCRHDLAKPELGAELYREAHIPGALFASLDRDLSGPKTGKNGRHPLPDAKTFGAWLGRQGLKRGDQVVCYDAANGAMAARLWLMLRWVGHGEVAVVLGGRAPSEVIHYCGSGVAACHNLLAMELAGLTGGKLYAGSWSEWQADPKRPREKG